MEIYKNPSYSIDERAKNLLSLMTLDEKIDQMHLYNDPDLRYEEIKKGKTEHDFGFMFRIRDEYKKFLPKIQKYAIENTRLGIPMLFCGEGLHGFSYANSTIFPQNIGIASSFNEDILYEIGKETGRAARARGIYQIFAPDLDVAREPRWGRLQETYGEDPYLIGKLGAAYVRGIQSQGVAATLKHYIGYSVPEGGLNLASGHIGEREIREVMLPPYEECIKAGAWAVMPAYNEVDGEPLHSSKKYLKDILRDELGFDGLIISDWGGVIWNHNYHYMVSTPWEAGKYAIEAGVDVEAPDYAGYGDEFKEKVRKGEISEELVDKAVLNILKLKFKLGLFDGNAIWKRKPIRTRKSVALARKAAEQSIVLLKNDCLLPLSMEKKQKIAVIGPNADRVQMGDYCSSVNFKFGVSPYKGLVNKLGEENVVYEIGCDITRSFGTEYIERAITAAKDADVVVLALGDNSLFEAGGVGGVVETREVLTDGEGFDVASLELMQCQKELFDKISALGKPLITVMYTGRPRVIVKEFEKSNAFIQAWYPGEQGGNALADILYGDVNPCGKLAVSLPRSDGNIPCYYNHHVSARGSLYRQPGSPEKPGRDYVFDKPGAFLPFGYGLSYTEYKYSNLQVKNLDDAKVEVRIVLENVGKRDGVETVLLFLRSIFSETVPYVKTLKAFKKVALKAGQKKTVKFILDKSAFEIVDRDYKKKVNYGEYFVMIDDLKVKFKI